MKTINYEIEGKTMEIEVSEECAVAYFAILTEEKRGVWRSKKRKESSLELMSEAGFQFEALHSDVEENYIQGEQTENLKNAILKLLPAQRELIVQIYFNGKSQTEIAREYGIGKAALHDRLQRTLVKLKKILEDSTYFYESRSLISERTASQKQKEKRL